MANIKTVGLIVAIAVIAILIAASVGLKGKAALTTKSNSTSVKVTTVANNTKQGLNISKSQFVSLAGSGTKYFFNSTVLNGFFNISANPTNPNAINAIIPNATKTYVFLYLSTAQSGNVLVVEYEVMSNKPKNLMHYLLASQYNTNFNYNFNSTNVTIDNLTYDYASGNVSNTNKNYSMFVLNNEEPEYTNFVGTKGKYVADVLIVGTQISQTNMVNLVLKQLP